MPGGFSCPKFRNNAHMRRYYFLSFAANAACSILIGQVWSSDDQGPGTDHESGGNSIPYLVYVVCLHCLLVVGLPFVDAAAYACIHAHAHAHMLARVCVCEHRPRLLSQRMRVCVFGFSTVVFMTEFVRIKLTSAEIYQHNNVPEWTVDGYVEISSLDVIEHTCMQRMRVFTYA